MPENPELVGAGRRTKWWKAYLALLAPLLAVAFAGYRLITAAGPNVALGLAGAFALGASVGLMLASPFLLYAGISLSVPSWLKLRPEEAKEKPRAPSGRGAGGIASAIYSLIGPQSWVYLIAGDMEEVLKKSWIGFTPEEYSALVAFYSLVASAVAAGAAFVLLKRLIIVPAVFVMALLLSIWAMKAYPYFQKSELADNINLRLPYVIVEMAALSASGLTIEKVLEAIAVTESSKGIKKVFSFMVRNIKFFGQDVATALSDGISRSPSTELAEFLLSLQTAILSGSDVSRFISDYARKIMVDKRIALRYMIERLNVVIEAFTTGFIVLPTTLVIMALLMSFVSAAGIALYFLVTTYVLVPIMGVMFILLAEAVSPR